MIEFVTKDNKQVALGEAEEALAEMRANVHRLEALVEERKLAVEEHSQTVLMDVLAALGYSSRISGRWSGSRSKRENKLKIYSGAGMTKEQMESASSKTSLMSTGPSVKIMQEMAEQIYAQIKYVQELEDRLRINEARLMTGEKRCKLGGNPLHDL